MWSIDDDVYDYLHNDRWEDELELFLAEDELIE